MAEQKNLKRQALDHIHELFISGGMKWGDLVSEEAIAKDIGISRTPVREALNVFTQMGILQRVPRYGTIVRTPELREFEELFDVRKALECYAIEAALPLITSEEIQYLKESCEKMHNLMTVLGKKKGSKMSSAQALEAFEADHNFHQGIIRATGNRVLLKHVADNRLLMRLQGTARVIQLDYFNLKDICADHDAIFEAIVSRNGVEARRLLGDHIELSKKGVVAYMKKQLDTLQDESQDDIFGSGY